MWQALSISMPRRFQIRPGFQQGLGCGRPRFPDGVKQPQRGTTRSLPAGMSQWASTILRGPKLLRSIFIVHINYQVRCFCWIRNLTQDKSEQRAAKQRCDLLAVTLTITHKPLTAHSAGSSPPSSHQKNATLLTAQQRSLLINVHNVGVCPFADKVSNCFYVALPGRVE